MAGTIARASSTKSEGVYAYVKERIIEGVFGPGYRLVLEHLARQTNVSPVPVREALRRLEAEGYVVYSRNVGASVATLDPKGYESIQGVIAVLEGAMTALSAPFLGQRDIASARDINRQMAESRDRFDPEEFLALNGEFHRIITSKCPNDRLVDVLGMEQDRMRLLRPPTYKLMQRIADSSGEEHEHILRLIETDAPNPEIQLAAQRHKLAVVGFVKGAQQLRTL